MDAEIEAAAERGDADAVLEIFAAKGAYHAWLIVALAATNGRSDCVQRLCKAWEDGLTGKADVYFEKGRRQMTLTGLDLVLMAARTQRHFPADLDTLHDWRGKRSMPPRGNP